MTKEVWVGRPEVPNVSFSQTPCESVVTLKVVPNPIENATYHWQVSDGKILYGGGDDTEIDVLLDFYSSIPTLNYTLELENKCGVTTRTGAIALLPCEEDPRGEKRIVVSPNPSEDFITAQLENFEEAIISQGISVYIVDQFNSPKFDNKFYQITNTIDISFLEPGIYYIYALDDKGIYPTEFSKE